MGKNRFVPRTQFTRVSLAFQAAGEHPAKSDTNNGGAYVMNIADQYPHLSDEDIETIIQFGVSNPAPYLHTNDARLDIVDLLRGSL